MAVSEPKSNSEQEFYFLSVRVKRPLWDQLAQLAAQNERTVSAEVRLALREHLERAA